MAGIGVAFELASDEALQLSRAESAGSDANL